MHTHTPILRIGTLRFSKRYCLIWTIGVWRFQVNGDIVEWVKEKSGEMVPVWVEESDVGFNISTKAVGSSDREDVTNHYKYKEGTEMERRVVHKIAKYR